MRRTVRSGFVMMLLGSIITPGLRRVTAQPPLPASSIPPPSTSREAELEARLRKLEAAYTSMERRHAEQYEALNRKYEDLVKTVGPAPAGAPSREDRPTPDASSEAGEGARDNVVEADRDATGPSAGQPRRNTSREGGAGARDNVSDPSRSRRPSQRPLPTRVEFGPGFQISSVDDEYQLQFHDLTQIDYRLYAQPNQDPVHSGFSIPRQRWYFTGRLTKNFEFYTTINRGYGALDLFDCFINYRYSDRLMFKVGRFKTPFSYEFYAVSAPDFLVPERSLFASNFSPNRQMGFMGWGQLLDKRLDYAVGMFNGNRFSFQDSNESKDIISYVNMRPFGKAEKDGPWAFLRNMNVGGSVDFGNENNALLPAVLRTSVAASNAGDAVNVAPPFLAFNRNVVEQGYRSLWGLHLAYFYKHLTLMGEWQSGYDSYAVAPNPSRSRTKLPVNGYYVAAGYFVTGEEVDRRSQVEPIKPFNLKPGKFGLGAIELQGRYSSLQIGDAVFTAGLADPNLWATKVSTVDLGVNWYLSAYTKIVLEWEHAMFGQPVLYAPGHWQLTSDLFWTRFQVYF